MKGILHWWVHWARRAGTRDFYPVLADLQSAKYKKVFLHCTLFHFTCPIAQQPGQTVVPGHMSLKMCLCLCQQNFVLCPFFNKKSSSSAFSSFLHAFLSNIFISFFSSIVLINHLFPFPDLSIIIFFPIFSFVSFLTSYISISLCPLLLLCFSRSFFLLRSLSFCRHIPFPSPPPHTPSCLICIYHLLPGIGKARC
jgi:hypothetical protein